ncbi:MAG TPA: redoxin domain-containing protein [Spirochaetota bacterium]|nr:redoxin domain-containing protein [Spirochaetota bacterium]HOD15384.1 redoxin domain-containing protein [Spirochaetota bacterium]HPG51508.1 redoxin domain-containing protein [Spirochaetota bacterium]HPN11258.1 redoxin domain-containing protein [Spirochaetota bacterium]
MRELKLKPGEKAPEFTLKNQYGQEVSLSSLKGKKVLLSFHPLAWTGVCEIQMKSLETKFAVLEELNTVALGLSVDCVPCKKAWAEHMKVVKTHLLADFWPHGDVAALYGLFIDKLGSSGRANVLIDEKGNIEWSRVYEMSEIPDLEEVIRVLKGK